jgi:hypothetical protein
MQKLGLVPNGYRAAIKLEQKAFGYVTLISHFLQPLEHSTRVTRKEHSHTALFSLKTSTCCRKALCCFRSLTAILSSSNFHSKRYLSEYSADIFYIPHPQKYCIHILYTHDRLCSVLKSVYCLSSCNNN